MKFNKFIKSLAKARGSGKVDSEPNRVSDEIEAVSQRVKDRRRAFDREAKRGSRDTEHRFTL